MLFWARMGVLFVLVSIVSTYIPIVAHFNMKQANFAMFFAAFAVMIPYFRGQLRLSKRILAMGKLSLEQRRFGDARFVLEYFHRAGNMGFDVEGEAHFYLMLACVGLGDLGSAEGIAVWLRRHRARYAWADKAARAAASAQRRRTAEQASEELGAEGPAPDTKTDETEGAAE